MTKKIKKSKIKDIFNGKLLTIWQDEEAVFISSGIVTIALTIEEYEAFLEDVKKLL